ncbi:uncharacterized protein [Halyomorpha halys]|uniref:uncharacterized protein n=1 Tax=Halyomorpha halys TaxID=286706 RepID=UPI0006D51A69|nr:uncharacterized protein LOC106690300 [Halyomorpha halys]XP_024218029.1 uncharacterized protein LOC112211143 [Halyomorpha halys]
MIILVILTIAVTVKSYDAKPPALVGDIQLETGQLEAELPKKLLPLWPSRKYISMSQVGKKIFNMSNMLGELLKEDKLKLADLNNIKGEMKAGMRDLEQLEQRCRYREKFVKESIKRNVGLLDKLRSFVKEKEKFDSQLNSEINVLTKEFKQPIEDIKKKKSSNNLIFFMPDRMRNAQLKK